GESIWDIKAKTGFVSPEMQQYFPTRLKALDVVCSGFFDSEGLFMKPSGFHQKLARQWLSYIGIENLSEKPFNHLSASQQRMVLIVRALVKKPPLLLLDEPFQGLDTNNLFLFKQLLNKIALDQNCTMVFISHFRDEIPENFTNEICLNKGKVEYNGSLVKK
ncbi:MAG: ATP-binding cassette domain-containing protein, partial [Prolixibacteraceae bacterium]|nr:ATP-binding cassette domain-containing protein [Prolixibacteraceae bacterium]